MARKKTDLRAMHGNSDWFNNVKKQIDILKDTLGDKEYKKFKLRLLLCIAERINEFSSMCGECQLFQQELSTLVQDIPNLISLHDKERQKSYFRTIDKISKHLQKQHKLVPEGYYIGIGMAIGSGIGVALGAAFEQVGGGIPIGVGIGLAIGSALDAKAKREGRILCPKEPKEDISSVNINIKVIAIVLGVLVLAGLAAFFFFLQSK